MLEVIDELPNLHMINTWSRLNMLEEVHYQQRGRMTDALVVHIHLLQEKKMTQLASLCKTKPN